MVAWLQTLTENHLETLIALGAFLLLYLTYYFAYQLPLIKRFYIQGLQDETAQRNWIYLRRTLGFFLLGILPLVLSLGFGNQFSDVGLGLPQHPQLLWWILLPTILLVGGSLIRPSKKIDTNYYPEVRTRTWSHGAMITNALFWFIYLLGYEFGIRGWLFFSLVNTYGLASAVMINSVIYSLIHIFKGRQEAFGAFFLGILFAFITYYTQSIWLVWFLHAMMAIINDQKAIFIRNQIVKGT
jgi:membrane protease YdiL (CAAX protease family)